MNETIANGKPSRFPPSMLASMLLLLALLMLAPTAVRIAHYGAKCASYPYQLDNEESYLLFQAMELRAGRSIYQPLDDYPFVAGTYAPGFQALNALCLFFGEPSLAYGRIISLLSALLSALLAGWIIFRQTRNPFAAATGPLLFFVSYEMTYWIGFARVDLLAIALSASGLALLCSSQPRLWRSVLAGLFFLAACYTKQSQFAAPLSAVCYLFFRERKTALQVAAVWLGGGALLFLSCNLLTGGQFYRHTVVFNANEFNWAGYLPLMRNQVLPFNLMLLLAALAATRGCFFNWAAVKNGAAEKPAATAEPVAEKESVAEGAPLSPTETEQKANASTVQQPLLAGGFFILYALLNLMYVFGMAKMGTALNYLLEPLFACALLIGVAVGSLARSFDDNSRFHLERRFLFFITCALVIAHAWHITKKENLPGIPQPYAKAMRWTINAPMNARILRERNEADYARALIARESEPVYCEWPLLNFLDEPDSRLLYQPFIMTRLAEEGKWDQAPFVNDLQNGRFKFLILSVEMTTIKEGQGCAIFTAEMVQAIQQNYQLFRSFTNTGLHRYYYYQRQE